MENLENQPSAVLIQPVLSHYRKSFFEALLLQDSLNISIIAGEGVVPVKTYQAGKHQPVFVLKNRSMNLGGHRFFWQAGLFQTLFRLKPRVIIAPGIDLHYPGTLLLAVFVRVFTSKKWIWWGHGTTGSPGTAGNLIRQFFFRLGHGILTYNHAGERELRKIFPAKPVRAIMNSLNLGDYGFQQEHEERAANLPLRILFSGRLMPEKRADVLVSAVKILIDKGFSLQCTLIGDGPELQALKLQAEQLAISEAIQFKGSLYEDDAAAFFRRSDLFVLPGKVGLSVVHALSFGLPVLTTGKSGIHSPEVELIEPGVNGGFFEDFSPESLADLILVWNKLMVSGSEVIRNSCRQSVQKAEYLPDKMAGKMTSFALKVLQNDLVH